MRWAALGALFLEEVMTLLERAALTQEQVSAFCSKWKIVRLGLFGSVLSGELKAESDLDVLVEFEPSADWSLFDHQSMQDELQQMVGRKVDLVSRRGLENSRNWLRKNAILSGVQEIYAA
jgi:predicted nucleotidyltransferase